MGDRAGIRNREIGFIFQAFNLIGDLTVYENVELPLTYRNMPSRERKLHVLEALERVGMWHRMKHYPSQLSGGQRPRVAVARARVGKPSTLGKAGATPWLGLWRPAAVAPAWRETPAQRYQACIVALLISVIDSGARKGPATIMLVGTFVRNSQIRSQPG